MRQDNDPAAARKADMAQKHGPTQRYGRLSGLASNDLGQTQSHDTRSARPRAFRVRVVGTWASHCCMQGIDLIIGAPVEATAVTASVKPQGMQKNEY